ncbi:serpin family protein [Kovacikia minuta CCNUW1]|uniref:serpin family protein n=1 Tax=Kovacikia minuta TaxID=2931930 RepID=UPI001CCA4C1A|nr:serpin family protein [Kovacikia minuta]UBF28635.1 serpin family protein [Kovacikia minuta CCNUW1]
MGQLELRRVSRIAAVSLLLLGLIGCFQPIGREHAIASPQPSPHQERRVMNPSQEVSPSLLAANTQFGFNLFSTILKQGQGKNVFVSPTSVAIALSMVYNGASGTTQTAIAKALALQGVSLDDLNRANLDLKAALQNPDPKVKLAIANSLWAREGIPFQPDFLERNQQFYGAEITNLNFSDPTAVSTINNWVKQNTQGKIDQIVDTLDPNDVLFLINAIYFKGDWTRPFDPKKTAEKPFHRLNGTAKNHPIMSQSGEYRYYETDQFQAVSLPYGQNRRMNMLIFLPKKSVSLAQFYQTLTPETWQQWVRQLRNRQGSVQIPRFKLEYDIELKQALSALGMANAFDAQQADFSGISRIPTKIDQVKHKTFVEVNEAGTEAAAVTSIGIRATSAMPSSEPFNLVVDRPFFCAIRDNQTGTLLFMGSIVDP